MARERASSGVIWGGLRDRSDKGLLRCGGEEGTKTFLGPNSTGGPRLLEVGSVDKSSDRDRSSVTAGASQGAACAGREEPSSDDPESNVVVPAMQTV